MKKMSLLFGILMLLSSCKEIEGELKVDQAFNVNKKYGLLNPKTREIKIGADTYKAELDFSSKKKLNLNLEGGSLGKLSILIKAEEDFEIPDYDGEFAIPHNEINQPFDIRGEIESSSTQTDVQHSTKSCTWEIVERQCDNLGCRDVRITIQGQQEYDYQTTYSTKRVRLKILKVGSDEVLANFSGSTTDQDTRSTNTSPCR